MGQCGAGADEVKEKTAARARKIAQKVGYEHQNLPVGNDNIKFTLE